MPIAFYLKRSRSIALTICAVTGLLNSSLAIGAETDVIRISAPASLHTTLWDKIAEPFKKETGLTFAFEKTRLAHLYFKDVVDGKVDAAVSIISYEDWLELANKENVVIPAGMEITQRVVARSLFGIIANKASGVTKLSQMQIVDLFSGKFTNWKQLGGADLPISIVFADDKPAIAKAFERSVLRGAKYRKDVLTAKDQALTVELIAATKGGVALDNSDIKNPEVIQLSIPELGRPITMITKGRPNAKIDKLINFIRKNTNTLNIGR